MQVCIIIFGYIFLGYIISIFLKRNDIADVMWGPGIFLTIISTYILYSEHNLRYALPLLLLVFLWAFRIFSHIGKRFISKDEEDFRYKEWRNTWKWFYTRSFFQVFLLQGILMICVGSTLSLYFVTPSPATPYYFIFYNLGILVALFGLTFETIADRQLKSFLDKKTGGIMKSGLWKYTRHPNYFGEVTFWWGLFIATMPSYNVLLLIGPITITTLILKVSGIPMLEKKYIGNKEFEEYKKVTPAFFPKFW